MKRLAISAALAATLSLALPQAAAAQDQFPMEPAEYVEVSAIHIDDGYALKYANHLATIWRASQDYALDVQRDRRGEHYVLTVPQAQEETLEANVLQVRPAEKHLLMMVRREEGGATALILVDVLVSRRLSNLLAVVVFVSCCSAFCMLQASC